MTPPKVKRHLVCPDHGEWTIEVGGNERCEICGRLGEPICACGCRSSLADFRSDAVYRSEACAKRLQRRGRPDIDPTRHPLQTVRDQQATKKHNRDLGGLIRQAIIDRLKTTGECHCDDLVSLYPEGEVAECRRLATAQFGSLAKCKLIHHPDNEWRASASGSRKGGGGWVWKFTKAGWDKYGSAGASAGLPVQGTVEEPDEAASTCSGDAGTIPGSGAGVATPQGPPGSVPSAPVGASTASPEPLSLLPEPDPESWAA